MRVVKHLREHRRNFVYERQDNQERVSPDHRNHRAGPDGLGSTTGFQAEGSSIADFVSQPCRQCVDHATDHEHLACPRSQQVSARTINAAGAVDAPIAHLLASIRQGRRATDQHRS